MLGLMEYSETHFESLQQDNQTRPFYQKLNILEHQIIYE